MKKRNFAVLFTLFFSLVSMVPAGAMLSEEEQREAYIERAVQKALREQTGDSTEETETESESESETAAEAATEVTAQTETEAVTEKAEAETETEATTEETAAAENETIIVALDPGHQAPGQDMDVTEPVGPGAEEETAALTEGGTGVGTGQEEYELNLAVAEYLKEELTARGYQVYMTRETDDVALSSAQRAQAANASGAQIVIRLHADTDEDTSEHGVWVSAPSYDNPYTTEICKKSNALSDIVMGAYCEKTGLSQKGLYTIDSLAGVNWSEIPVCTLEMGYLSNAEDDAYMAQDANRQTMAEGIADGVDLYFGR